MKVQIEHEYVSGTMESIIQVQFNEQSLKARDPALAKTLFVHEAAPKSKFLIKPRILGVYRNLTAVLNEPTIDEQLNGETAKTISPSDFILEN